jgi:hypothetical protein
MDLHHALSYFEDHLVKVIQFQVNVLDMAEEDRGAPIDDSIQLNLFAGSNDSSKAKSWINVFALASIILSKNIVCLFLPN